MMRKKEGSRFLKDKWDLDATVEHPCEEK